MLSQPIQLQPVAAPASAHAVFAGVACACVAPALIPIHTLPIPSFYEEWIAAACAMLALLAVMARSRGNMAGAPLSLRPLAVLALVLVAQMAVGRLAYPQQALVALLYVLLAMASIWCGLLLRELLGLERAARWLAFALLAAGTLSAGIALLQSYVPAEATRPLVAPLDSPRVFANLGQPNLLANQLSIAGASLLFLWATGALGHRAAVGIGALLIAAVSLTGSRSVWLYGVAVIAWTFFNRWRTGDRTFTRLSVALFIALVLLSLAPALLPSVTIDGTARATHSSFERLAAMRIEGTSAGDGLRLYFWKQALHVAQQAPWLGAGIGQFAVSFIEWPPHAPGASLHPVERNAHNLWLHLLAETGVVGTLCVLVALGSWLVRVLSAPADLIRWWLVATIAVTLLHSQLEYPLWHAHFLVPFAMMLGLGERAVPQRCPRVARFACVAAIAVGTVALASLLHGYHELRTWVYQATEADLHDEQFVMRQREAIRRARASLLAPYAELPLAGMLAVNTESLEEKLVLNQRAMRFAPIPPIVLRHVVYLTLAGRHDDARRLFETAARLYPRELPAFSADLERLRARGLTMEPLATYVATHSGNN